MASHSGATRTDSSNKPDFDGFLSPLVLARYGAYMHKHRKLADGSLRESDNWQRGIPFSAYAKSLLRHVLQFHGWHRGFVPEDWDTGETLHIEDILCAIIFNASGYLHEILKRRVRRRDGSNR